jgi:hypothetical protein
MLLSDEEVQERIESPLNLLNRLKNASKSNSPCLPNPTSDELIPDLDDKLQGDAKKQAAKIMHGALRELEMRLPEVHKPEKLAQIANEMGKFIMAGKESDSSKIPQVIVYAPSVIQESHFASITLNEEGR